MKKKTLWCVVVGKPKMSYWKSRSVSPDMENVGRKVLGSNGPETFKTRKEARADAKDQDKFSKSWHYHAEKMS